LFKLKKLILYTLLFGKYFQKGRDKHDWTWSVEKSKNKNGENCKINHNGLKNYFSLPQHFSPTGAPSLACLLSSQWWPLAG
jgi:hypothetical protein